MLNLFVYSYIIHEYMNRIIYKYINCGAGEDSSESRGLQGDQTSQF